MPLENFPVMVDIQKENGVQLIEGVQSGVRVKEFIAVIASEVSTVLRAQKIIIQHIFSITRFAKLLERLLQRPIFFPFCRMDLKLEKLDPIRSSSWHVLSRMERSHI